MPVDLQVTMLFVDQGMGNLVELVDTASKEIVFRALVDFGSAKTSVCTETVTWLAKKISTNKKAKLDLLVISHKDNDHWSLLPKLAEELGEMDHTLEITLAKHGNKPKEYNKYKSLSEGTKKKRTILEYMSQYQTLDAYPEKASSYVGSPPSAPIVKSNGVAFKVVTVNVPAGGSAKDIIANTASLVLAIEGNKSTVMLPGDATAETCKELNRILENAKGKLLAKPAFLGVPHHGALRTLASNYITSDPNLDVGKKFADTLLPKCIGASAGFSTHRHPSKTVLDLFTTSLSTSTDHPYVQYDNAEAKWVDPKTKNMVYTTYLNIGPKVKKKKQTAGSNRANWRFRIDPDGDLFVLEIPLTGPVPTAAQEIRLTWHGEPVQPPAHSIEPPMRNGRPILMARPQTPVEPSTTRSDEA
ncbi:MAG TPA: hypothetical protein VGL08_11265 [Paraburkholderia sp.]|jgi:beta-lactamase superfamily II metal-dependent hydrolase